MVDPEAFPGQLNYPLLLSSTRDSDMFLFFYSWYSLSKTLNEAAISIIDHFFLLALPESGPRITARGHQFNSNIYNGVSSHIKGGDHRSYHTYYRPGDDEEIEVNCTSSRSKPAAALHWYVNGIKVSLCSSYYQ